jgi:hypothetical protein
LPFQGKTGHENLFTLAEFQDATEGEEMDWEEQEEDEADDEENEDGDEGWDDELHILTIKMRSVFFLLMTKRSSCAYDHNAK